MLIAGFTLGSPALPAAIDRAEEALGVRLPIAIHRLLLEADGREGTFDATDEYLVLYSIDALVEANDDDFREAFPGYLAIGDNGGLETYALDLRESDADPPMVQIDRNDVDSAELIAPDLEAGIRALAEPRPPTTGPEIAAEQAILRAVAELGVAAISAGATEMDQATAAELVEHCSGGIRGAGSDARHRLDDDLARWATDQPASAAAIAAFRATVGASPARGVTHAALDPATALVRSLVLVEDAADEEIDPDLAVGLLEGARATLTAGDQAERWSIAARLLRVASRLDDRSAEVVAVLVDELDADS